MLGRCVVIGSTRGPGQPLAPRRLMVKAQSLSGLYLPSFFQRPELIQCALRFLANGEANGSIKANVGAVLPLSRTPDAHRLLERREVQGIVVLDPRV